MEEDDFCESEPRERCDLPPECPSIPPPPGENFRTAYCPDAFCVVRKQTSDLGGH